MSIINESNIYDPTLDIDKVISDGGFVGKDGRWNSIIKKGSKLYRERVETIIVDHKGDIFLRLCSNSPYDYKYKVPGGSTERNISKEAQAYNECKEEARIIIKNIINTGMVHIRNYGEEPLFFKRDGLPLSWDGTYTYVFIARYDKRYDGFIKETDRDEDICNNGKFHKFEDVKDILGKEHLLAYEKYILGEDISTTNEQLYPYYTPRQMISIGVYNEDTIDNYYGVKASENNYKWFKKYAETGDPGKDWSKKVTAAYNNYLNDNSKQNRQTLLELGWNPEINFFNDKICKKVSDSTKLIMKSRMEVLDYAI